MDIEEQAAASLMDLRDVGKGGASRGPESSVPAPVEVQGKNKKRKKMCNGPRCQVDATPLGALLPMRDEEGDGAPGSSGQQAAQQSDAEPGPGPEPAAGDRQSDPDQRVNGRRQSRRSPYGRKGKPDLTRPGMHRI